MCSVTLLHGAVSWSAVCDCGTKLNKRTLKEKQYTSLFTKLKECFRPQNNTKLNSSSSLFLLFSCGVLLLVLLGRGVPVVSVCVCMYLCARGGGILLIFSGLLVWGFCLVCLVVFLLSREEIHLNLNILTCGMYNDYSQAH